MILFAGQPIVGGKPQPIAVPQGLRDEHEQVAFEKKRADTDARKKMHRGSGGKKGKGKRGLKEETKDWVLRKKELYRTRGKEGVPRDSKCVPLSCSASSVTHADLAPRPQVHGPLAQAALLRRALVADLSLPLSAARGSRRRPLPPRPLCHTLSTLLPVSCCTSSHCIVVLVLLSSGRARARRRLLFSRATRCTRVCSCFLRCQGHLALLASGARRESARGKLRCQEGELEKEGVYMQSPQRRGEEAREGALSKEGGESRRRVRTYTTRGRRRKLERGRDEAGVATRRKGHSRGERAREGSL